jgi:3-isopropylmalate/(R)-2-methylmalate dehydratase small subunit
VGRTAVLTSRISTVQGRSLTVRGDDIDTDRIIPARFLKCITFDDVGTQIFVDDIAQAAREGGLHSFADPHRTHARILFVNKNFGCGSSREHAAQGLKRWNDGIRAIVGESFAEIFFGNCLANGIPCVVASAENVERLMRMSETSADAEFTVDLESLQLRCPGDERISISLGESARKSLLEGQWDSTSVLMEGKSAVMELAQRAPYFARWGR